MSDVVITEFMDDAGVAELEARYDVVYDKTLAADRDRLGGLLGDARALVVRNRTEVDVALLDRAPRLRVVGRLGVGLDNIDLEACAARGIQVMPATGANAVAVAEYVIAVMLLLFRGNAYVSADRIADGEWPREDLVGRELSGKRLGLVGLGTIAAEVGLRADALGMAVGAHDPLLPSDHDRWAVTERMDLDDLFRRSDAVSLHVPLTDETRGLVDADRIASMGDDALLVNTSRGGIVDEDAVCEALRSGTLGGAALDVFADEPVDAAGGARFREVPNLVVSPHIAGVTTESNRRTSEVTARNVVQVLEGSG